jgi:ADP-ribosylglycohydrolase/DNA invertase Pin-like site-specific DNA recombinase
MDSNTKRAVIYTRVSTVGQAEKGTSLVEQFQATLAKAAAMNAQVVGHEEDAGVSGAFYSARPGINRAIESIERGDADTLIIANFDRFSRDREHQSAIKRRVENAGGRLVFCDLDFEDTPEGDLAFGIMGSLAQYERKRIRERTVRGRRRRAEEGIQVSRSMRPYGYILVNRKTVLAGEADVSDLGRYLQHPEEAKWVKFMFECYASGDSLRQIALKLHNLGVPTARGGREWEPETISGIIQNPVHKGQPTFGREQRHTDESRQERGLKSTHFNRPAPPEEVIVLTAPAIVTEETWGAANARLAHNKIALRGRRDRKWLLTGLLRCPKCGLSMRVQKARGHERFDHYSCPHYSPAQTARRVVCDPTRYKVPVIEEAVINAITEIADQPASIEAAFNTFLEQFDRPEATSERRRLASQMEELKRRENAVIKAQIAGIEAGADPAQYDAIFAEIRDTRSRLQKAHEELGVGIEVAGKAEWKADAQRLSGQAASLVHELLTAPELTPAEKHPLLSRLIKRIVPAKEGEEDGLEIELHGTGALIVVVIQMTLAVGEALAEVTPPYTIEKVEGPLRRAFVEWMDSPDNDRAPGFTCMSACRRLKEGGFWWEATVAGSKGCGANMRVAPVGMLAHADPVTRAGLAQFQAALTHGHPTGLAASDLTAFTLADLRAGGDLPGLIDRLQEYAASQRTIYHAEWLGPLYQTRPSVTAEEFIAAGWDECLNVLARLKAAVAYGDWETDPCRFTGEGWVAEEAFATGLLCFLLFPDDPIAALRRAAVTSGDSDSIACLTGAFAGAYYGIGAWPEDWLRRIEYRDRLQRLAEAIGEQ